MKSIPYIFLIILALIVDISAKQRQEDVFSVHIDIVRPNKYYTVTVSDNTDDLTFFWGGGVKYNRFNFSAYEYFKGYRSKFTIDIFKNQAATPYIGLYYVRDTKASIRYSSGKLLKVDGFDTGFGLSFKMFDGLIQPYAEYTIRLASFHVGARFHFYTRKNRPPVNLGY